MKFEWDADKAEINWRRHRVKFETAVRAFVDPFRFEEEDIGASGWENRWRLIGLAEVNLLVVIYTERSPDGEVIRVISARKANAADRKKYYNR